MNPLTALPAKVRKSIYAFYATLGIAFGAVQVGFGTAHADQPGWLLVAFAVFGYLGTALGLVAASNVSTRTGGDDSFTVRLAEQTAAVRRQSAEVQKVRDAIAALPADLGANVGDAINKAVTYGQRKG